MNTTLLAMGIAFLVVLGLVVNLGVLSLLSGAFHFLFARPSLEILKSENGESGFAIGFRWNNAREPASFDQVKLRLFNPFAKPTQVDVSSDFTGQTSDFGVDVNLGPAFVEILNSTGLDNSTLQIEVVSKKDGITHYFNYKTRKFLEEYRAAAKSVSAFNEKYGYVKTKPVYHQTQRSFIADPLPQTAERILKIQSNPAFAGAFTASADSAAPAQENFTVAKVWIEDGCIVCNACEGIYPEVFEVTDTTCLIRPGAPLDDGLKILESAEACPVEVIKFTKAS